MVCDSVRDYERERENARKWDEEQKRLKKEEQEKRKKALKDKSKKIAFEQCRKLGWNISNPSEYKFTATKPYSTDKMEIEILDTGTIRISQDKISPANHTSAENFHRNIQSAMGGNVTIKHKLGIPHSHGAQKHTH